MTPADLIGLGFAACEVAHLDDGSCSCRLGSECPAPGKHPVGRGWKDRAVLRWPYPRRLPAFVTLAPATSYGLVPVPGSGLMVIDRDDPEVGLPMPETFEVHRASADPRRGHFYYRLADGISEDDVPRTFAGGEVRVGGSGFVVGPGCRHSSGDLYAGNDRAVGIADLELIDALRALKPVRRDAEGVVEAVEGSRHAFLVGQARKLAGWGWHSEKIEEELRLLNDTLCTPPLTEKEAEFGRIAQWAETNIAPDGVAMVRRINTGPKNRPDRRRRREARGWNSR